MRLMVWHQLCSVSLVMCEEEQVKLWMDNIGFITIMLK